MTPQRTRTVGERIANSVLGAFANVGALTVVGVPLERYQQITILLGTLFGWLVFEYVSWRMLKAKAPHVGEARG